MKTLTNVTRELPPMWVLWNYVQLYQVNGLEWQSPELKTQIFVTKTRKLLRKVRGE